MGKLLLDSLEIQNFRGFRHLQIEKLGRVNLIVGKNNIGKSSLLEALELYAWRGVPDLIWQFLSARNELHRRSSRETEADDFLGALKYLFYGMEEIVRSSIPICVGPINVFDETLVISLDWYTRNSEQQDGLVKWRLLQPEEFLTVDNPVPRFTIAFGEQKTEYPLPQIFRNRVRITNPKMQNVNCVSIKANGLSDDLAILLWDSITLTDLEGEVINALRIIAPGVKDLSFVGYSEASSTPIPYVKIEDIDKPLPLGNLGNGMFRLLGIALAIANAKDGILLIDEIENGIHYSAQQDLWELVFRLARRLNVQVFATTHSWDCIQGLQRAAERDKQEEGMLIRLSLKKNEVAATLFDEEELQIATRERIEVR